MIRRNLKKFLSLLAITMTLVMTNVQVVYAAANYGENAGTWVKNQLFWLALIALVIVLVGCLVKRAWVAAIITILGGGVVLYFINDPEQMKTIGENIAKIIFK